MYRAPFLPSSKLTRLLASSKLSIRALVVEHAATLQVPLLQLAPEAQTWPQTPQFPGSVCVLTQALLHTFVPVGVLVGPHVPVASPVLAELQA